MVVRTEEQLLELLLQLKKTTPDSARAILNAQPQIAYALITLMVNINAVDVDVLQKTVAAFGAAQAQAAQQQSSSAIPPHMQSQYGAPTATTPPVYPYSNGHAQPRPVFGQPQPAQPTPYATTHVTPPPTMHTYAQSSYATPPPAQPTAITSALPEALAAISDDQKAIIMRVISMTPEEINQLPAAERTHIIQLRTTLGLQSG